MIRVRLPRRSLHVQLTLLYAVPFLISGVVLLGITLLGNKQATPAGPVADTAGVPGDGGHLDRQFTTSAWAVAGVVVFSLLVIRAESVVALLIGLAVIGSAGTLFWFLVKSMARIQMPERPGS